MKELKYLTAKKKKKKKERNSGDAVFFEYN